MAQSRLDRCTGADDFSVSTARRNCPFFKAATRFGIIGEREPFDVNKFADQGWGSAQGLRFFSLGSEVSNFSKKWWIPHAADIDRKLSAGPQYRPRDQRLMKDSLEELDGFLKTREKVMPGYTHKTVSGEDILLFRQCPTTYVAQVISAAHDRVTDPSYRATRENVMKVYRGEMNLAGKISYKKALWQKIHLLSLDLGRDKTTFASKVLFWLLYLGWLGTLAYVYFGVGIDPSWDSTSAASVATTSVATVLLSLVFLYSLGLMLDQKRTSYATSLPSLSMFANEETNFKLVGTGGDIVSLTLFVLTLMNIVSPANHLKDNPVIDRSGHNNVCVLFDFSPEKEIAGAMLIFAAVLGVVGTAREVLEADYQQRAGFYLIVTAFYILLALVTFFDVDMSGQIEVHLGLYFGMIVSSTLLVLAGFLYGRYQLTCIEHCVASLYLISSIYSLIAYVAAVAGCRKCLPPVLNAITDYVWVALLPLVPALVLRPLVGRNERRSCRPFPTVVDDV